MEKDVIMNYKLCNQTNIKNANEFILHVWPDYLGYNLALCTSFGVA